MAEIKVQVTRRGDDLVITAHVSGPDWALGLDPDEALKLYANALSHSLGELWQRNVGEMVREMIEGAPGSIQNPRGLFP